MINVSIVFTLLCIIAQTLHQVDSSLGNSNEDLIKSGRNVLPQDYQIYKRKQNSIYDWDALIFTQSWPPSDCMLWRRKSHRRCRNLRNYERWTIHGIWPTKWGTTGPSFCDRTQHFSMDGIHSLLDQMRTQWAPIEESGDGHHFWSHEWEKHGTCAKPSLNSQHQYFSQALQWNSMFNLDQILSSGGISPGREYDITRVWTVLTQSLQVNPQIKCLNDNSKNLQHLLEIKICFDKNLSLINCQPSSGRSYQPNDSLHSMIQHMTTCNVNIPVAYPTVDFLTPQYFM